MEIKESKLKPAWEGKRVWLNLSSIGISAMYFGSAQKRNDDDDHDDDQEKSQPKYKMSWLNHMMLDVNDHESDPPGVKVRSISNLEGVDYLTPGAITSHLSYVFGPVINALQNKGYNSNGKINLAASTYDWRLAPSAMERRDKYFTRTLGYIEELYNSNDSTPVVILSHSLGCKVAHYFLNFALDKKGQSWIDKYVHTYMPVGGPHLGAPKAMRGMISGDKMGLDTFLKDEEGIALGRSFGSGPWLVPQNIPDGCPSTNYIVPHGVLEISFTHAVDANPLVRKRQAISRPKRYKLLISAKGLDGFKRGGRRDIQTPFHRVSSDLGQNVVVFTNDKISFATHTKPYHGGTLQFFLQEPGIASAKKEKGKCKCNPLVWCLCCCCIPCMLAYKIVEWVLCGLISGATLTADAIARSAGNSSTLAFSESAKIPAKVWNGKVVTVKVPLYHIDDYRRYSGIMRCLLAKKSRKVDLFVKLKWVKFDNRKSFRRICSPVCRPSSNAVQLPITTKDNVNQEFSGYDIMEREGLEDLLKFIRDEYDDDKFLPRSLSAIEPPPIKRVHAIYGVNLPTEVGCVYTRQDTCLSGNMLQSLYIPDKKAKIGKNTGYKISGGLIMENPRTKQKLWEDLEISGDGTVPYWSLAHSKTWNSKDCYVTTQELDKAPHREILADPRFHEAVFNYVSTRNHLTPAL